MGLQSWFGWWVYKLGLAGGFTNLAWLVGLQTWLGWWVYKLGLAGGFTNLVWLVGLQTWFGWWVYKLGLAGGFTNLVWLVGLQTSPTVLFPSPLSKISRTVTDLPPKSSSTAATTIRLRNRITSVPFITQRKGLFYIHTV